MWLARHMHCCCVPAHALPDVPRFLILSLMSQGFHLAFYIPLHCAASQTPGELPRRAYMPLCPGHHSSSTVVTDRSQLTAPCPPMTLPVPDNRMHVCIVLHVPIPGSCVSNQVKLWRCMSPRLSTKPVCSTAWISTCKQYGTHQ